MGDLSNGIGNLLVTFANLFVFGFASVWLMMRMVQGDMDVLPGVLTFFIIVTLMAVSVWVPDQRMAGPVLVVSIVAMAFFPFAETQLDKHDLTTIDYDRIEKVHKELSVRPNNLSARFELARVLWDRGLQGHAIAICENTLGGLSTERDMMTMQSLRDKFRAEDAELKKWKAQATDPRAFDPIACAQCGHMNPPGTIVCEKCQSPYLLALARSKRGKRWIYARLTTGFALTCLLLVASAYCALSVAWPASGGLLVVLIGGVGVIMNWLFRPKTMRD